MKRFFTAQLDGALQAQVENLLDMYFTAQVDGALQAQVDNRLERHLELFKKR